MKKIFTICIAVFALKTTAQSQPVLVSGFSGMASVNGTTHNRIGTVGNTTGGYGFVCASNDRMKFFSTWFGNRYLYFIDPATFNVLDSMNYKAYSISASNEPNTLFARTDYGLSRINTLTKTAIDSISIPSLTSIAERPNTKEVWVVSGNNIHVVDYTSSLVATPFTFSPTASDNGEIKFTKGGTIAYKCAWVSKKVYKINAVTKTNIDSVVITGVTGPNCITVSADSSKLFVSFPSDKKVRIYSTSTMAIIDSIDCGTREPFDMYTHPDRAEIWVVNHFDDTVTVFNENTHAQIAAINVTSSPHPLAFGIGTTADANDLLWAHENITAYPNPTDGLITISGVAKEDVVYVYDYSGKLLISTYASNEQLKIDITTLSTGNYFLYVCGKESRKMKKYISFEKL